MVLSCDEEKYDDWVKNVWSIEFKTEDWFDDQEGNGCRV